MLHTAYSRAQSEAAAAGDTQAAGEWAGRVAEIDAAIDAANDAMLGYVADHAGYARVGRHGGAGGTGRWVDAHDLVVASFYQHTSRDLDPQLHVHNAVLNRVECPDGQWRSIDSRAVHGAIHGASAVASARAAGGADPAPRRRLGDPRGRPRLRDRRHRPGRRWTCSPPAAAPPPPRRRS